MNSLKMAVIGVGSMGKNHVRILSDMNEVSLVAIADQDETQLARYTRRYNLPGYTDIETMFANEALDAVSICVPTAGHYEVALKVIAQNLDLLIEKPIALSIQQGKEIIQAAEAANVTLTIGHVERFNPAVIDLRNRISQGELGQIFQIEAHRASPFPAHVLDVGVVTDLAVHDLDVMRYITQSEVVRVSAEISRRVHKTHEDQLIGLLRFADDTIGKLTVNWLTPTKVRELAVVGERGMFLVNYLTQDLTFFENSAIKSTDWDTMGVLRGVNEGPMTRYIVPKKEPLRSELEAFVQAIQKGEPPSVTGQDGVAALALAQRVLEAGNKHQVV